jgi:ABC-2 type transport system permease protein/oleandomycin transport system permease protein
MTASSTTVSSSAGALAGTQSTSSLRWAVSDIATMTWRNLLTLARIKEVIFLASLQPVIFVLLFRYVFGGVVRPIGVRYVDYMLPGMLVYTVTFASLGTAIAMSQDMHAGLVDRFRALPMVRGTVLAGRTTADLIRASIVVLLLSAVGYMVGFRVAGGVPGYLAGVAVVLLFFL